MGGGTSPQTGKGDRSAGVNFHPNWSTQGVNFNPNWSIKFSQKWPKKVAKYENLTNITQREWLKTKKIIPKFYKIFGNCSYHVPLRIVSIRWFHMMWLLIISYIFLWGERQHLLVPKWILISAWPPCSKAASALAGSQAANGRLSTWERQHWLVLVIHTAVTLLWNVNIEWFPRNLTLVIVLLYCIRH